MKSSFDFGALLTFIWNWITAQALNVRRLVIIFSFLLVYPLLQLLIWTGLLLDRVFYPAYHRQEIKEPVFITGIFRSGTTFLHRLMAKDAQFSTMKMWEILFAPSITQRRFAYRLGQIFGPLIHFIVNRIDKHWAQANKMHKVSLREPEEDDYVLLHIWSAFTIGMSSGQIDLAEPYMRFDKALSPDRRARVMDFYRAVVQRHIFANKQNGIRYLAKNPALCPKLASLDGHFPDAKIVYLVRRPEEVIASFYSMMRFSWRIVGATTSDETLRQFLFRMVRYWYDYPLEYLAGLPSHRYIIVNYEELKQDPARVVREIYDKLGLPLDDEFAIILEREREKARAYRSEHHYSLAELGLDECEIHCEFEDIYRRFHFSESTLG